MKKKIILKPDIHRNQEVIFMDFSFDNHLLSILRKLNTSLKWSQRNKNWYVPKQDFSLNTFYNQVTPYALLDYSALKRTTATTKKISKIDLKDRLTIFQKELLNNFYKYLRGKRFSNSTLRTYTFLVAEFVLFQQENDVLDLRCIEIYIETVLVAKKVSISTHRQFISAMKHYLVFINSDIEIDFTAFAPKKDIKLPNVLSHQEVLELIRVTKNLKHRICIALIYSSGLRIGELINLKIKDLDTKRLVLKVVNGKGRKDRFVPIAKVMLPLINNYLITYKPKIYFIESLEIGLPYSPTSIRKFLARSCRLAHITKKVTPHTLRHSYATHLLENGTDIRYIQELLGHTRPETTMLYTHVQSQDLKNITNPLDLIVKQIEQREKIK